LNTRRADLVLLLVNVVYGTAYATQRVALGDVPPALLGFIRLAVALLVLLPFLRRPAGAAAVRGDGHKIFWMGVLGFGAAYALSHVGMQRSTATNAALLVTTEPIAVILLSPLLLGERLRRREAWGATLVLLGSVIVVVNGIPGVTFTVLPHWRGDLLLILSGVAFASYSLFGRHVLARWDARAVTARSIAWGAVSMAPLAALERVSGTRPTWTAAGTLATLYLALVVTVLAYLAWNYCLARVSAPRAAIFINVQPVVGVALSVLLLGETATLYTLAGAILVISGLAVTTWGQTLTA
jgi:drug/metabolite transporter (DMT)-like permease